jgi:hypothetical protein
MAFKDKDEFLDAFFDHIFPEGTDVDEEDEKWFDHASKFFDQFTTDTGNNTGGNTGENTTNPPRRRRQTQSQTGGTHRRRARSQSRSDDSQYGSRLFFGN